MSVSTEFRYKCIEDVMRLNNGLALLYMARRSNLNLDGLVPGTQKSYMQMAIEHGADGVIDMLLKEGKSSEKVLEAVPYLLSEEKKTLICEQDEKAQSKKMFQLMAIASAIAETGVELKQMLKNAKTKTPIVKYLQSYQAQMG